LSIIYSILLIILFEIVLDWKITSLIRFYLNKIAFLSGLSLSSNIVVLLLILSVSAPGDV
jgi:hypothetical protein